MNGLKDHHREFNRETSRNVLSSECVDCHYIGAPNKHGRCERCDSAAIVSCASITLPEKCINCGQTLETGHLVNATLDAHLDCSNPCGIAHTRFEVACA